MATEAQAKSMTSRHLSANEIAAADNIAMQTEALLEKAAAGDEKLLRNLRRRVAGRLTYSARGTPSERRKIKKVKWIAQQGICAFCGKMMLQNNAELDRLDTKLGYTTANTRLVHQGCQQEQEACASKPSS